MTVEVSELIDGESGEGGLEQVLPAFRRDPAARLAWDRYCLVGDALRGVGCLSPDFTGRVMSRIADEPTVLAPAEPRPARARTGSALMALAASVTGVAIVAWLALGPLAPADLPAVASVQAPATVSTSQGSAAQPAQPPVAARDQQYAKPAAEVAPYLFVHSGYIPSRTMQGVVPYVRVVSETPQGSGR